ncbi:MAG: FG-GAP-like repeat-containing protein [Planctomycetaceae bacterium]
MNLSWTAMTGNNEYYVWIDKKSAAGWSQISDSIPRSVKGNVLEYDLPVGEYRARVRSLSQLNAWSQPVEFEVAGTQSSTPEITSTSASIGLGGALTWTREKNAVRYEVEIRRTGSTDVITSMAYGTELRGTFLSNGVYTTRVRSIDAAGLVSAWSASLAFTVISTTYKPVITSSPGGIQVSGVRNLEWNQLTWASGYEVTVTRIDGTTNSVRLKERLSEPRFTFPKLSAGTYVATVKAFDQSNTSGPESLSGSDNFVVTATTYQTTNPILAQSGSGQRLEWPRVSGAVKYDVVVARLNTDLTTVHTTIVRQSTQNEFFPLDHRFAENLPYRVNVRPVMANGEVGTYSENVTFSLSSNPGLTVRITPNSDNRRPRVEWTNLPTAVSYRLRVFNTSTPTVAVIDQAGVVVPYFQLESSLPAGTYTINVEATLPGAVTSTGSLNGLVIPSTLPASASSDIRVSLEDQRTVIKWVNSANGFYDIRLVRIEQPENDVVREQTYFSANSPAGKSYSVRGGYSPGLYRVDIGQRTSPLSSFEWKSGPIFSFDGNTINSLQANGVRSVTTSVNLTGPFRGDFDGDGRTDLLTRNTATGQIQVYANDSTDLDSAPWDGFSAQPTDFVNNGVASSILVGDFNGDGRDDLLQPDMDSSTWAVMRSTTENRFEKVLAPVNGLLNPDLPALSWNVQTRFLSWKPISSIFNFDRNYELRIVKNGSGNTPSSLSQVVNRTGRDNSAATFTADLTSLTTGEYTVFARTTVEGRTSQWSDGFSFSIPNPNSIIGTSNWSRYFVGDFNGDHRDDIAAYNSVRQQWVVALANGTFFERSVWSPSELGGGSMSLPAIADVNGDGRKDLVYRSGNSSVWTVGLSTGTSFLMQSWNVPAFLNSVSGTATLQVADMNADGREDLVAPVAGGFQVAFAGFEKLESTASGTIWQSVLMPSNSVAVDVNGDRRADLVGFDSAYNSIVALSTVSGFKPPEVWQVDSISPWFTQLWWSGVSVVDYQYRAREVENAFKSIRDNVEYEGYRGLKKGADGTLASKSGNAWDQANLLGTQIKERPWTNVRYVTGRMKLTPAQVNAWLTTTNASATYFNLAGLNGAVDANGNIEFDHAWLQAWLPTATGLNWVDLNPSFKSSLAAAPTALPAPFLTDDLKAYLSPITRSFSADFDSGGALTAQDTNAVPAEILFSSGGGRIVTENTWPKLVAANGLVDDYKLMTNHASPTNVLVGQPAVNGKFSASIIAQEVAGGTVQDFRVYARATDDYEIGFIWPQGASNAAYSQKLYERIGDNLTYLNATVDATGVGAPAFQMMVPNASDTSRTAAGVMQCQVDLTIENNTLTAFVQWKSGTVVYKLKLTSTVASRVGSGRFGIYTAGSGHHYLDNIKVEARDVPNSSPLEWTIEQKLASTNPSISGNVAAIGQTRTILGSAQNLTPLSLTPVGLPMSLWNARDYQTITISFLRPDGVVVNDDSSTGLATFLPKQLSEIVRGNIVVRTAPDGKSASLLLNNVTYIKTVPFTGNGTLRLRIEHRTSPTDIAETQILPLQPDSYSQILLRAGQYSATDVANAASGLAEAYNQYPLAAINNQVASSTSFYNLQSLLDRVLSYSAMRLLSSSEQSEDEIARMTQAILVRPGVTAGLLTGKSNTVQPDSVFFVRPRNITVDFPVGKVLYVPRADGISSQIDEVQQSQARLSMAELSAREQDLLVEISDDSSLSALKVLSLASANGAILRQLKRNSDGTYSDKWNPSAPASTTLTSFLSFGTSPNQLSALNQIQQQLNAGGIVTVTSTMQSLNGWTGFAWLHERYVATAAGSASSADSLVESLMLSNNDGSLLHGGVVSNSGTTDSSDFSQFRDTGITPDLYRGVLRRSDTDFTVTIPGMTIPFTRTWTSSRSDASTTTRILDGTDISGFGVGWTHPFSQQLDVTTMTPSTVYYIQKGNWFTGYYYVPIQNNTDRIGEPASLVWHREDGTAAVFSPNGKGGTTTVNSTQVKTAEYDNPFNMPGIVVRRIDGITAGVYGDSYEIVQADGAIYRFQDFNSTSVRQSGKTTAYLVSIRDRFGNTIEINRDPADRSRILSLRNPVTQRVLANFTYTNSRITRIVVPQTSTGNSPTTNVTGTRIWDYFYDAGNRLTRVKVSEASGTDPAWNPTSTISRFAYSWYDKISSGTETWRGDRLEGFLKSATGYSGTTNDNGDSSKTLYRYYGNGRLCSVRDAEDQQTTFLYHPNGNLTSTVDASGALSTTQFSDLGDMEMSSLPSGERILYEMAPNVRQTDRTLSTNGRSESWTYDNKGNVIEHRDAAGITQLMTYHPVYNQVVAITERSTDGVERRITLNEYFNSTDAVQKTTRGALYKSTDALGNATQYRYTPQGLIAEVISPRWHKTVFDAAGYDTFGNPLRVDYQKFANGVYSTDDASESIYDNTGHLDQVREYDSTGARNRVTEYTWDALGRLTESSTPDPYVSSKRLRTQYFYNSLGLLDRRIDPDGSVWRKEYDNTGRLLREIRPDGTFSELQYNTSGTVVASIDPNRKVTRFVYDALNRLVQTLFPDGTTSRRIFDARGDLEQEIDPRGFITRHEYDSAGRLLKTIDAQNQQTTYSYDTFGNQISISTAKGIITNLFNANRQVIQTLYESRRTVNGTAVVQKERVDRFFYDGSGNQVRSESIDLRPDPTLMPDSLIISLTDSLVNIAESTSVDQSRKRTTTSAFDFRDRAISSTNAAGGVSSKTYLPGQDVASSKDARGAQTSFFYDLAGQIQFEAMPTASSGELTGLAKVYRRDSLGRVVETRETAYQKDNATGSVQRNSVGEPTSAVAADSPRVTRTFYDSLGRVIATQNAMGFMTRVTYDPAGNVVESIDATRRSRFKILDSMNRVVREVLPPVIVASPSAAMEPVTLLSMPMTATFYDESGNVVGVTDAAGQTTTFLYDGLNRQIQKTAPTIMRDLNGVQVPANPVWKWTYDALGNMTSEVDPAARTTTYTYDMFGRVLSKTLPDPDGSGTLTAAVTEFTYDAFGNLLSELEKGSLSLEGDERLTTHEYNALNLRVRTTSPDPDGTSGPAASPVRTWSYDANGNLIAETNPLGRVTNYTWNLLNQPTKTELPAVPILPTGTTRSTTLQSYDLFGNVTAQTDALGRITRFDHDAMGRVILTIMPHPDGVAWSGLRSFSTTTDYDANGNVIRVADHMARVSTSAYDSFNRVIRTTKPDPYADDAESAPLETISYDINGNVARKTDALGRVTRFEYDALNRQILTAVQDGSAWAETETRYDLAGNATRIIDPLERVTVHTFNNWNLQTQVLPPSPTLNPTAGPITKTAYDQWGNVLTVTGPRGGVTQNEYDQLNRLTRQLLPLPGTNITRPETTFEYDAAGNVVLQSVLMSRIGTSEVWTETETTYDELNRVIRTAVRGSQVPASASPSQESITTKTYDKVGNVLTVTRQGETSALNQTTSFQYDRLNRKVAEIAPPPSGTSGSPVTRYRYDLAGNLEATIDPLGRITSNTYDALGRLCTTTSPDPDGLQGPLSAPLNTFRFDAVGNLLSTTDQLGRTTASTYDSRNRVLSVTQPDADLTDDFSAPVTRYAYDLIGNKIQETDALGGTTNYEYDNLNRLTAKILPDALVNDRLGRPKITFSYDLSGNVISTTDAGGRTSLAFFDLLNRKTQDRTADPDGASISNSPLITMYTYDAVGNQLTSNSYRSATVGRITRNEYDYLNRLIRTTAPPPASTDAQMVTIYSYDVFGNQISVTETTTAPDAVQKTTVYVYDKGNRRTEVRSPDPVTGLAEDGPVSMTTYDLVGRVLTEKDPLGRIITYSYDDLDRQIRVVGHDPDASGNATADTIPAETLYSYDEAGSLASTRVRRNENAILATASSADVFTSTTRLYDRLDRLTTVIDANGDATQYRYDNNGQRIRLTDASWNTSRWQYDALGHVIAETDANGLSTVFEYDLIGNVTAVTDRRGFRTQFVRDNFDRVTNEQWLKSDATGTSLLTEFRYKFDHYGRPYVAEQWNLATVTPTLVSTSTKIYDDLDRLLTINNGSTPGQNFSKFTYDYDASGHLTSRDQQTGSGTSLITVTTAYSGYDYLNRLTQL